jgi:hypothetical protein
MPTPPDDAAAPPEFLAAVAERKRKMVLHTLAYVAVGAVLGFGYYKLVGCASGGCPITSNPYISTLYGALIGLVAGGGLGR